MITPEQTSEKKNGCGKILLIIGAIIVIYVVGTMALNYPRVVEAREHARSFADMDRALEIVRAIDYYANQHNGITPPNLEALCPKYLNDITLLDSPVVVDGRRYGYELMLPNRKYGNIENPSSVLLLRGQYENAHGEHVHIYLSGGSGSSVRLEKEMEAETWKK